MKNTIRKITLCAVIAVLLAVLGASPALGDTCSITGIGGTGSVLGLNYNNVGQPSMSINFCSVTNGTDTWLQESSVTGAPASFGALYSVQELGWNGDGSFISVTDPDGKQNPGKSSWSSVGPKNLDGFGTFNTVVAATDSPDTDNIFQLAGGVTDVAIHFKFTNGCTGFASNIPGNGSNDTSGTGGCDATPVPEPATLTLLGTGLVGLGTKLRRKLIK